MSKEDKIVNGYYESKIKTSRNEDSVYAMKYASQQMIIDKLQQENEILKEQLEKNKLNHKQLKDLEKTQLLNSYQVEKLNKLEQQRDLYKSVIDEVREYFNNSPEWEEDNMPSTSHYKTKQDILQTVDKINIKESE